MKIAYLTWGETPRNSGVFGSQAIGQFLVNSAEMPSAEFFFISAIPLIHSGLIREKSGYANEIGEIRRRLDKIPFYTLPIYAPQNFIFSSKYTFRLMHFGTMSKLSRIFRKIGPDVVHCRSYHAAYAALKAKERFQYKYQVVFDPRGIWSEEVALRKGFSENSVNYGYLKELEAWIVRSSDVVVSVSLQMAKYFESLGAVNSQCIYLSAPVEKIVSLRGVREIRGANKKVSLVYLGTLGSNTWHRPLELISLVKHLQSVVGEIELKIVTMSNAEAIRKEFKEAGFDRVSIVSSKTLDELASHLTACDFGILSYFNPKSQNEKLLSSVVMAVKTAEYLAAGLPILVNKTCGGAAGIVETHSVGIAYNPDTFEEINEARVRAMLKPEVGERSIAVARELFDYRANARRYQKIYEELVPNI